MASFIDRHNLKTKSDLQSLLERRSGGPASYVYRLVSAVGYSHDSDVQAMITDLGHRGFGNVPYPIAAVYRCRKARHQMGKTASDRSVFADEDAVAPPPSEEGYAVDACGVRHSPEAMYCLTFNLHSGGASACRGGKEKPCAFAHRCLLCTSIDHGWFECDWHAKIAAERKALGITDADMNAMIDLCRPIANNNVSVRTTNLPNGGGVTSLMTKPQLSKFITSSLSPHHARRYFYVHIFIRTRHFPMMRESLLSEGYTEEQLDSAGSDLIPFLWYRRRKGEATVFCTSYHLASGCCGGPEGDGRASIANAPTEGKDATTHACAMGAHLCLWCSDLPSVVGGGGCHHRLRDCPLYHSVFVEELWEKHGISEEEINVITERLHRIKPVDRFADA